MYYRYWRIGNELNQNSNDTNPFRFAGEYWDSNSGTYYLRARNYNPTIGRFTQEDPHWNIRNMVFGNNPREMNSRPVPNRLAIMQSGNLYVYALNNPIKCTDPSGLMVMNVVRAVIRQVTSSPGGAAGAAVEAARTTSAPTPTVQPVITRPASVATQAAVTVAVGRSWTREDLTDSQRIFVATIAGEGIGSGSQAWQWIAHVIVNRVDHQTRWTQHTTTNAIIRHTGFDAYTQRNTEFRRAMDYLAHGNVDAFHRPIYRDLINTVIPIYYRMQNDITGGATHFYSPVSMTQRGSSPHWASAYERIPAGDIGENGWFFRFLR